MKKRKVTRQSDPLSQSEFIALIKEGEKGPFKPLGTFEEFKKDVLATWKKLNVK
jgi:Txe/YoeB family toxin of Txe-Axe toxin-antitoxin module